MNHFAEHPVHLVRVNECTLRTSYTYIIYNIYAEGLQRFALSNDDVPQTDPDTSESGVRPSPTDNYGIG